MASPQLAQPFPDFEIDTLSIKQAKSIGPLLVVVWRADCPTCKLTLPFIERMAKHYRGASVIGISQDGVRETAEFVEKLGLKQMANYADPHLKITSYLDVDTVPAYWLVGRDGKTSHHGEGWDARELDLVAQALAVQTSVSYTPLVLPTDEVPLSKPG